MNDSEQLHHGYYSQFVTQPIKDMIRVSIGAARIADALNSGDKHLNTIPLKEWDTLASFVMNNRSVINKVGQCGETNAKTVGVGVCILKAAARIIAEEESAGYITE